MKFRDLKILLRPMGLVFSLILLFGNVPNAVAQEDFISDIIGGDEVTTSKNNADSFAGRGATFSGNNFESLPWKGSVMFDQIELQNLYSSLASFRTYRGDPTKKYTIGEDGNLRDEDDEIAGRVLEDNTVVGLDGNVIGFVNEKGDIIDNDGNIIGFDTRAAFVAGGAPVVAAPKGPAFAPSFYLNSVLYYNQKNWTFWLNNQRIRYGADLQKIKISNIKEDLVEIVWETKDLDLISPGWKDKLTLMEGTTEPASFTVSRLQTFYDELARYKARTAEDQASFAENLGYTLFSSPAYANAYLGLLETSAGENTEVTGQEIEQPVILELPEIELFAAPDLDISKLSSALLAEQQKILDAQQQATTRPALPIETSLEEEDLYVWKFTSDDGNIVVDQSGTVIKFRIGINQTFVSRNMEIIEGFAQSVVLNTENISSDVPLSSTGTNIEDVIFQ